MSAEAISFNWKCKHTWKRSAKNTAWCLLGCAIGDFGTILFFQLTKKKHYVSIYQLQKSK